MQLPNDISILPPEKRSLGFFYANFPYLADMEKKFINFYASHIFHLSYMFHLGHKFQESYMFHEGHIWQKSHVTHMGHKFHAGPLLGHPKEGLYNSAKQKKTLMSVCLMSVGSKL